jgi:hypothetical protein
MEDDRRLACVSDELHLREAAVGDALDMEEEADRVLEVPAVNHHVLLPALGHLGARCVQGLVALGDHSSSPPFTIVNERS